jgi:epoxyqueuosine reductase
LLQSSSILDEVRARARSLGFDAFGVTSADARPDLREKLEAALAAGWHGDMAWMAERADQRASPSVL